MSGLGHPIIGFDHFAFMAVGVCSNKRQGILLPLLYCDVGNWTHLIGLTLPELSCLFGFYLAVWALLVLKDNPNVVVMGSRSSWFTAMLTVRQNSQ